MRWQYLIMHQDTTVATINSDGLCRILAPDFMPYNLYLEDSDDISIRVENLDNFNYWCSSRVLPLDRVYAKEILNAIGAGQGITDRDRARIALTYRCVTLTDVFWVKRPDERITFSEINLYNHSLSDAFVEVSLFGKAPTAQNMELLTSMDSAGDTSTQGAVPKAWIRRDGVFYLLKDGGERDVNAELLASRIARCFAVDQVLYEPATYNRQAVTRSRLITSPEYSIVPMEYVDVYAANHDTDRSSLIRVHDPYGFHMMNIVDYLVGNIDRHWGNWGFLIDNRTNLPVKLYPLMDFNKSFLAYDRLEGTRCLTMDNAMSQMEAAIHGVQSVGLNQISDIKREWFSDPVQWEMFSRRLSVLQEQLYTHQGH